MALNQRDQDLRLPEQLLSGKGGERPGPVAPPAPSADGPPNPRALVTASGYVFQVLGGSLIFAACGGWLVCALTSPAATTPAARWTDYLAGPNLATALLTLGLFTGFVGGLGLMAAGLGMQGEKKSSAMTGMVVGGSMALVYLVLAILLMASAQRYALGAAALILVVLCGGAAILAAISHSTLCGFPPPDDYNLLTDEIMEDIRRRRDERRKEYDL